MAVAEVEPVRESRGEVGRVGRDAVARLEAVLTSAIAERARRGETIPGFGPRLYPEGDPRAAARVLSGL